MSRKTVPPRAARTEKVRPKRGAKKTAVSPPESNEHSPAAPPTRTTGFDPNAYVKTLERLRVDVRHGHFPCDEEELDAALRCQGWDVAAGDLVAQALRDNRLTPRHLLTTLAKLVEEHIQRHASEDERGQALVFLEAAFLLWFSKENFGSALDDLRVRLGNEWGESMLVCMAIDVFDLAAYALPAPGDGYTVSLLEYRTRGFIRSVFDHAGLEAVRDAVAHIHDRVTKGTQRDASSIELGMEGTRWGRQQELEQ